MGDNWGQAEGALAEQWTRVRARLRSDIGEAAFNSWLKPLTLGEFNGGRLRVAVPTRFMRDWIDQNYGERLAEFWGEENDSVRTVEIIVQPNRTIIQPAGAPPRQSLSERIESEATQADARPGNGSAPGADGALEDVRAILDERFKFANFVVGRSNELAHAAARRVAEAKSVPFNPLFLYGGVGLGKTHLMHAIAWHIAEREPRRRVLYMSAEKFMYQFIRALRYRTVMDFKEQFRSVDVLMIDDIQFIAGKDSTQEE
ncbi:MAG: DnaA/Hda family protein, partial [Alphaproteobacteria bacterium]